MKFTLPQLSYEYGDLEPHISAKTMELHHGKHHQGYVDKTNKLSEGTEFEGLSLEEIIKKTVKDVQNQSLFNNTGQTWNHNFFWKSLSPQGGGEPDKKILKMIKATYGSLDKFKQEFKEAGVTHFGSGWVWLILENGSIKIENTANGDNPIAHQQQPLIGLDIWEHAYYLDYQNKKPDYIDNFLNNLINWRFLEDNLEV
ncbi:MAG: superoxide dismutase [Candidatus Pacebacteria bacterium]|nr:superoxide dismutase [Candidatus Paceibacterota bacterium]